MTEPSIALQTAGLSGPRVFPVGGGEMGRLIRNFNWSGTSLGPIGGWPQSLKTAVDIVLRSPVPLVMLWNAEGVMLYNDAYAVFAGGRHPHLLGLPVLEGWPEVADFNRNVMEKGLRGETLSYRDQCLVLNRHGTPQNVWMDLNYSPILDESGQPAGVLAIVVETTQRVQTEQRFSIAQRAGAIGAFEWFPDTGELAVSDEYRHIWGFTPQTEITEQLLVSLVHPEDRGSTGPARLPAQDNPLDYVEYRITRPDTGEVRWIARRGEVVKGNQRAPRRFVGVAFDITARKRTEEVLQRLNHSLEEQIRERTRERDTIWRVTQDLLVVGDESGVWLSLNPAWEATLGWREAELLGKTSEWLEHPEDKARSREELIGLAGGRRILQFQNRLRHKDGSYRWISWNASNEQGRIYATGRDVTSERAAADALRAAEEALRQSQKMEAVGQLTGGIAHDFNNLLQGIVGSLSVVQKLASLGRASEIDRFVAMAMSSANRAASLTHRLLAFSRRQPLDPKPVNANQLVASMEDLLRRTMGEHVELQLILAGGLWPTRCDHNQLENAILNLAINARDAMPSGGKLTIETCNAHLDNAYVAAQRDVNPGQYVCLCVTDTGTGMAPNVVSRAFDPFFTTKPIGQGTGLGLSMIYGFARQSEGHARIYSEVGHGTTVKVYLPRYRGEGETVPSLPILTDEPPAQSLGTILVVEDELIVRELIAQVLCDLGYGVLESADGPAGLRLLRSAQRVDLLVTDVGLPGLNGRQLADAARETRPELKVLFMTGYAENAAMASGFLEPGMQMLTKPFAMDAFTQRVRSMLEEGR